MASILSQIDALLGMQAGGKVSDKPAQPYQGNHRAQPNQRELPADTLERLRKTYLGPGKSWTSENYREPMAEVNKQPDTRPRYADGGLAGYADGGWIKRLLSHVKPDLERAPDPSKRRFMGLGTQERPAQPDFGGQVLDPTQPLPSSQAPVIFTPPGTLDNALSGDQTSFETLLRSQGQGQAPSTEEALARLFERAAGQEQTRRDFMKSAGKAAAGHAARHLLPSPTEFLMPKAPALVANANDVPIATYGKLGKMLRDLNAYGTDVGTDDSAMENWITKILDKQEDIFDDGLPTAGALIDAKPAVAEAFKKKLFKGLTLEQQKVLQTQLDQGLAHELDGVFGHMYTLDDIYSSGSGSRHGVIKDWLDSVSQAGSTGELLGIPGRGKLAEKLGMDRKQLEAAIEGTESGHDIGRILEVVGEYDYDFMPSHVQSDKVRNFLFSDTARAARVEQQGDKLVFFDKHGQDIGYHGADKKGVKLTDQELAKSLDEYNRRALSERDDAYGEFGDEPENFASGGLVQNFADAGRVRSMLEILAEKAGQVDARLPAGNFSPAARGIATAPQDMTGAQWQNFLKSRQVDVAGQKFPVRSDEVEFTGLGKLLEGKADQTVPRGALLDYLRGAGRVTPEEEALFQKYVATGRPAEADEAKRFDDALRKRIQGNNDARYPDQNTLVSEDTLEGNMDIDSVKIPGMAGEVQYPEADYQLPGAKTDYREELTHWEPISREWSAGHFSGDDMNEGLVSHSRVSSRKTADGRPVVHVDEIQSDLHREARDEGGYKLPVLGDHPLDEPSVAAIANRVFDPRWRETYGSGWSFQSAVPYKLRNNELTPDEADVLLSADDKLSEYFKNNYRPPRAPYQDRYHEVELNKALRRAVQEDADEVTWTTGEQQAQRYPGGANREQGMSNFYDRTVRRFAEQWARRFPGAVVDKTDLGGGFNSKLFKEEFDANFSALYNGPLKRYFEAVAEGSQTAGGARELALKELRSQIADDNFGGTFTSLPTVDQRIVRLEAEDKLRMMDDVLKSYLSTTKNLPVHSLKLTPEMKAWIKKNGTPIFSTAGAAAVGGNEVLDQIDQLLQGEPAPKEFADGGRAKSEEDGWTRNDRPLAVRAPRVSQPDDWKNIEPAADFPGKVHWTTPREGTTIQDLMPDDLPTNAHAWLMTKRGHYYATRPLKYGMDFLGIGQQDGEHPLLNAAERLTGYAGILSPHGKIGKPVAELLYPYVAPVFTKKAATAVGGLGLGLAGGTDEAEGAPKPELLRSLAELEATHLPKGTFSPAARAIAAAPQDMNGQQWSNFLKNRQVDLGGQKFPVKTDELEFSGLDQWLKENETKPVGRGDLLDFLTSGEPGQGYPQFKTLGAGQDGSPQYDNYQMEGPRDRYRENLTSMPDLDYNAAHFSDDAQGLISWSRTSERPLTTGEKATHIDEIQSDLHQQGRDSGYRQPPVPRDPVVEEQYTKAFDEAQAAYGEQVKLHEELSARVDEVYDQLSRLRVDLAGEIRQSNPNITRAELEQIRDANPDVQTLRQLSEQLDQRLNAVPRVAARKAATRARILRDSEPQHRQIHQAKFDAEDAMDEALKVRDQATRDYKDVHVHLGDYLKQQRDMTSEPELALHNKQVDEATARLKELEKLNLDGHPDLQQEQRELLGFTYGAGHYARSGPVSLADEVQRIRREMKEVDDALAQNEVDAAAGGWYSREKAVYEAQLKGLRYQPNPELEARYDEAVKRRRETSDAYEQASNNFSEARLRVSETNVDGNDRRPPRAPYKDRYHEVEFNKALRAAVDADHDVVTWTTGDTQAKRWSQSIQDQVSKLALQDNFLKVTDKNGHIQSFPSQDSGKTYVTPQGAKSLEDILGRSMADKLVKQGSLEGDNLSLGGGGFKNFYDDKLGKHAESWARRFPGAKVEPAELPVDNRANSTRSPSAVANQAIINSRDPVIGQLSTLDAGRLSSTLTDHVKHFVVKNGELSASARQETIDTIASLGVTRAAAEQLVARAEKEVTVKPRTNKVHSLRLTPELKAWIKKHGVPVMGVAGVSAKAASDNKDDQTLDSLLDDVIRGKRQVHDALETLR